MCGSPGSAATARKSAADGAPALITVPKTIRPITAAKCTASRVPVVAAENALRFPQAARSSLTPSLNLHHRGHGGSILSHNGLILLSSASSVVESFHLF